jgi:hypothetical protein
MAVVVVVLSTLTRSLGPMGLLELRFPLRGPLGPLGGICDRRGFQGRRTSVIHILVNPWIACINHQVKLYIHYLLRQFWLLIRIHQLQLQLNRRCHDFMLCWFMVNFLRSLLLVSR